MIDCREVEQWYVDLPCERAEQLPKQLRKHIEGCAACRQLAERYEALDQRLAAIADQAAELDESTQLSLRREVHRSINRPRTEAVSEIMTPAELAAWLKIPSEALDECIEQMPCFELAGQIRFRRSRVEQWLAEREQAFATERAAYLARRRLRAV